MATSSAAMAPLGELQTLARTLRTDHDGAVRFFEEVYGELDAASTELEARIARFAEEQASAQRELFEAHEDLERRREAFERDMAERQAALRVERESLDHHRDETLQAVRALRDQLEQERGVFEAQLANQRLALLEAIARERRELEAARERLVAARDACVADLADRDASQSAPGGGPATATLEVELRATCEKVTDLANEMAVAREKSEQERGELLNELQRLTESVQRLSQRGQAVDVALIEERASLESRRTLLPGTKGGSGGETAVEAMWSGNDSSARDESEASALPSDPSADPLWQSVLAQFEALRKDLAAQASPIAVPEQSGAG